MPEVRCEIVRWTSDHFPGWVAAVLTDVNDTEWRFEDKLPVFTSETLSRESPYPAIGAIRCEIVDRSDQKNRLVINTARPDGVASVDDESTLFTVPTGLVTP